MRVLCHAETTIVGGGSLGGGSTPGGVPLLSSGSGKESGGLKCPLPGPAGKVACLLLGEAVVDGLVNSLPKANPDPIPTDERVGLPGPGGTPAPGGGYYFQ